jgi:GNAT superfamily N-acetyltransferase
VRGWHEGLSEGWLDVFENPVNWDDEIIYATGRHGKVMGFISYANQEWNKVVLVRFGYVLPEHRRKGVYKRLYAELVKEAKAKKATRLSSATFLKNRRVRAAAKQRGNSELKVTLDMDL